MTTLERSARPTVGPSFFEEDGVAMFQFVLDGGNIVGPRKATRLDKEQYVGEWESFNKGRLPQLDRDGDGFPGGSLPHNESQSGGTDPVSNDVTAPPKRRGRPPKG